MGVERQARGVRNAAHQGLHFARRGEAVDRNRRLLPPRTGIRGEDVALGIHCRIADRMQISSQQAGDFETNRIARLSVLPDFQSSGLYILGYAHDHAVGTAEQNRSLDPSSTATGRRERTAPNWVPRTSTSPPGSAASGIAASILGEFGIGDSLENRIGSIPYSIFTSSLSSRE